MTTQVTLHSGWVSPDLVTRLGTVATVTESGSPLCEFCVEQERYDLAVGRESSGVAAASVRFDGKLACGWCATFHWTDPARNTAQPVREFERLSFVVALRAA